MRKRFTVAVMVPKAELVAVVLGAANTGWFGTLNISPRNWKVFRTGELS